MSAKRRKFRNVTVPPRSLSPDDEKPFIWGTKTALNRIKDAGGDSGHFAVYWAHIWLQNNSEVQDYHASFAKIGRHSGCSPRTVERKLELLYELDLLGSVSGVRSNSEHEANCYTLATTRYVTETQPLRQGDVTVASSNSDSLANSKEEAKQASSDGAATAGLVRPACVADEAEKYTYDYLVKDIMKSEGMSKKEAKAYMVELIADGTYAQDSDGRYYDLLAFKERQQDALRAAQGPAGHTPQGGPP